MQHRNTGTRTGNGCVHSVVSLPEVRRSRVRVRTPVLPPRHGVAQHRHRQLRARCSRGGTGVEHRDHRRMRLRQLPSVWMRAACRRQKHHGGADEPTSGHHATVDDRLRHDQRPVWDSPGPLARSRRRTLLHNNAQAIACKCRSGVNSNRCIPAAELDVGEIHVVLRNGPQGRRLPPAGHFVARPFQCVARRSLRATRALTPRCAWCCSLPLPMGRGSPHERKNYNNPLSTGPRKKVIKEVGP